VFEQTVLVGVAQSYLGVEVLAPAPGETLR
jgi:hypothetical protein